MNDEGLSKSNGITWSSKLQQMGKRDETAVEKKREEKAV